MGWSWLIMTREFKVLDPKESIQLHDTERVTAGWMYNFDFCLLFHGGDSFHSVLINVWHDFLLGGNIVYIFVFFQYGFCSTWFCQYVVFSSSWWGDVFFQDDFVNRHSELTLVQLVSCIVMESILEKGCIISRTNRLNCCVLFFSKIDIQNSHVGKKQTCSKASSFSIESYLIMIYPLICKLIYLGFQITATIHEMAFLRRFL